MIAYLIKFILCSGFLYSFYKLFLERESMYKINRFYLLFALIFALIAPLYKIQVPITAQETNISPELLAWIIQNPEFLEQEKGFNFGDILNIIYLIIGTVLLGRFIYNLYELLFKIKTEEKLKDHEITYILDLESEQPYSFWKYIFIPKKQINKLHQNLIDHEKAHCIQKHSFDILLIEVFQIIFWFNPFVYFYKKSIKLNHEFLADEYVLMQNNDVKTYQHQILDSIAAQNPSIMASHFNFILTKKRLLMMTKNTSKQKVKMLSFATLPFLLSAFVLFSQKTFAQKVEQNAQKVENALDKSVDSQAKLIFEVKPDKNKDSITQVGTFIINPKDSIKNIDPKDIKSIDVDKKQIIITKNNNDTVKYYVNYNFTPSETKLIQIKNLKTNELLTEDIKNRLNNLHPKDIKKVDVRKLDGKKLVIINDSIEYSFDDKISIPNNLDLNVKLYTKDGYTIYTDKNGVQHKILNSEIDPIFLSKINDIKLKKIDSKNPWSIKVEQHSKNRKLEFNSPTKIKEITKFRVESAYFEDNKSISEHLEQKKQELKLQEKNTKKMLKEVEKQQRELKKSLDK